MLRRRLQMPEDLRRVSTSLRDLRPTLPEERMQQLAATARNRARLTAQADEALAIHRKESLLRSRVAITFMLVLGFALSGAGAGMAMSGLAGNSSPSSAVYTQPTEGTTPLVPTPTPTVTQTTQTTATTPTTPTRTTPTTQTQPTPVTPLVTPTPTPSGGVLPGVETAPNEAGGPSAGGAPAGGVKGEAAQPPAPQQARQLGAQAGGSLPVTGWAALPILLLGLALVGTGLGLGRAKRSSS